MSVAPEHLFLCSSGHGTYSKITCMAVNLFLLKNEQKLFLDVARVVVWGRWDTFTPYFCILFLFFLKMRKNVPLKSLYCCTLLPLTYIVKKKKIGSVWILFFNRTENPESFLCYLASCFKRKRHSGELIKNGISYAGLNENSGEVRYTKCTEKCMPLNKFKSYHSAPRANTW